MEDGEDGSLPGQAQAPEEGRARGQARDRVRGILYSLYVFCSFLVFCRGFTGTILGTAQVTGFW